MSLLGNNGIKLILYAMIVIPRLFQSMEHKNLQVLQIANNISFFAVCGPDEQNLLSHGGFESRLCVCHGALKITSFGAEYIIILWLKNVE
jgi:hypothetical protein